MEFLVAKDGQRQGPYSEEQIKLGLEEGWLREQDLIWYEGLADWQRVDEAFEVRRLPVPAPEPYPKAMSPVAPFAAQPASGLPARTQVIRKQPLPAKRPGGAGTPAPKNRPATPAVKPVEDKPLPQKKNGGWKWAVAAVVLFVVAGLLVWVTVLS